MTRNKDLTYSRGVYLCDMENATTQGGNMFETIFTAEPRDQKNPLHRTIEQATEYGEANTNPGEDYEIWTVANNTSRTRLTKVRHRRHQ